MKSTASPSKSRNGEPRASHSTAPVKSSISFRPHMASISEASHEGESIITTREEGSLTRGSSRETKAEIEKLIKGTSAGVSRIPPSFSGRAWSELERFTSVSERDEFKAGSTGSSHHPETSSKTRHEIEALKKELAQMGTSAGASHMPTSLSSRAWSELERFTSVERDEFKAGSTGSSRHPETSSKTRYEIEALKKELAQMKASARASRTREINRLVRTAQELDLAFLFDATSSMNHYMEVVKNKILEIAHGVCDAYAESHIRVAFVFYRDYNDKENCGSCNFTISFNGSRSTFVEALSCVEAKGGGDTAEDVFSGLQALAKLDWTAHNRVVYHIADAPCHGIRFHDGKVSDNYPNGDLHGRDIAMLIRNLREDCKLTTYTFLHIGAATRKMLQEFKRVAGSDNSWIHEDEFQGMDVEDIPTKVVMACRASISHSLSTISGARMKLSNVRFVPRDVKTAVPDWDAIRAQEGEVYKFKRYGDLDEVLRLIEKGISLEPEKTQCVQVQVALHPFSNDGASRWPFYAQIVTREYDIKTMVVKRFKDQLGADTSKVHTKEKYIEQMEVQAVSAQFAEEFQHCIRNIREAKKVAFTIVSTLHVQPNTYYNMEKVLTGLWTKFNNNAGYVNDKGTYTDTLQAFSHWTHERSRGMVRVTDLQGVQISSVGTGEFLLCDPAIHSRDVLRFTRTNLGEKGFELFYKSHKCTSICQRLGLKPTTCHAK